MSYYLTNLIESAGLEVVGEIQTPSRSEKRRNLSADVLAGGLEAILPRIPGCEDDTVWEHQAQALDHLASRRNVVVSTGTASGKSLVFQIEALRHLVSDQSSRILVIYPLKALASDQFERWKKFVRLSGLDTSLVGLIDGDVKLHDRDDILNNSRVLLMTPDICHAWLMRNVGSSSIKKFLTELRLVVLDEAHIYESVFGSNVAFLMRRLTAAHKRLIRGESKNIQFRVIASTATILNPADHLRLLTGFDFAVVEEEQNGAPHFSRKIIHVGGAERGPDGEKEIIKICQEIMSLPTRMRFLAFIDSRQGVERVVRELNEENVLPYRSGYATQDRKKIETSLRDGTLHGVIATSALELGIDISDLEIGMTLGIPQSRKTYHQRLGRVGRASPGVFLVITSPLAFARLGLDFLDYHNMPVESSHLYLGNRFIQFAHARCLLDEMELLGVEKSFPPKSVNWPIRFEKVFAWAKGEARPREFDYIAQLGANSPHINYPLRQVGEGSFDIQTGGRTESTKVGTIGYIQAIREAYPGANYLQMGKAYKVNEWRVNRGERIIRVNPTKSNAQTRPILKNQVNLSLNHDGIVDARLLTNKTGILAEAHVQVNESVEGYLIGNTSFMYSNLRTENPAMSRKQRDFRTTGLVLRIMEDWFRGSGKEQRDLRRRVGVGLRDLLAVELGISPYDVDSASTRIGLVTASGLVKLTDAVVVYDVVYESLRLTERLYDEFKNFFTRLGRGASLAGADAMVSDDEADKLRTWAETLTQGGTMYNEEIDVPDGWRLVYKRGSIVGIYLNNVLYDREIINPTLMTLPDSTASLFYEYRKDAGKGYVPHDQIQAKGHEWGFELWNSETGEFQSLEESDSD